MVKYKIIREVSEVDAVHFSFETKDEKQFPIGMVYSCHNEGLSFAFNIDPAFHKLGIAKNAFRMAFSHFSSIFDVQYIEGAWFIDEEFSHLKNGASINLSVYKKLKAEGNSNEESAFATPTGKIAFGLGFCFVEILAYCDCEVKVRFYKNRIII